MSKNKQARKFRIKKSIRRKISGTAEKPRLSVYRSNRAIYAQLIDDTKGHTLVAISSAEVSDKKNIDTELAKTVGSKLGEKATQSGIDQVVFDRNGYLYHGRVKALAEGAREAGLKF